jgi:hypothetical protein
VVLLAGVVLMLVVFPAPGKSVSNAAASGNANVPAQHGLGQTNH